jgi:hypothetical protein
LKQEPATRIGEFKVSGTFGVSDMQMESLSVPDTLERSILRDR